MPYYCQVLQCLIEAACHHFVWAGKWDKRSLSLVAWSDVCVPRNEGGLGIKQVKVWNRAFSA